MWLASTPGRRLTYGFNRDAHSLSEVGFTPYCFADRADRNPQVCDRATERAVVATAIICRTVLGSSALTSLSLLRNQGLGRFSMKNTGRMIAYDGKPRSRVASSTRDLLSKWGMPVLRSAAA